MTTRSRSRGSARGRGRGRGGGGRGRAASSSSSSAPARVVTLNRGGRRRRRGPRLTRKKTHKKPAAEEDDEDTETYDPVSTETYDDVSTEEYIRSPRTPPTPPLESNDPFFSPPRQRSGVAREREGQLEPFDIQPMGPRIVNPEQINAYIQAHNDRNRDGHGDRARIIEMLRYTFDVHGTVNIGAHPYRLSGLSLRELCECIDAAGYDRRSLFISGTCVDYQMMRNGPGLPIINQYGAVNTTYQIKKIIRVPMSEIVWDAALSDTNTEDFNLRTFLVYSAVREFRTEVIGSGELPHSNYILHGDISITKADLFPSRYQGIYQFRTGGFDRIVLYDETFHVVLPAALGSGEYLRAIHSERVSAIPATLEVYIPGSANRAVGKLPNCIVQCLAWGLYQITLTQTQEVIGMTGEQLSDMEKKDMEIEAIYEAKSLYNRFYDQWFNDKVSEYWASHPSPPGGRTNEDWAKYRRHVNRLKSNWNRLIVHGFSNVLLRRFIRFLCTQDICMDVLLFDRCTQRFVRAGEASVTSTDLRRMIDYPYAGNNPIRHVLCLQVNLDGEVQTTDILENPPVGIPQIQNASGSGFHNAYGRDMFPGLLHCIALFPPRLSPILRRVEETISEGQNLASTVEDVQFDALKMAIHKEIHTRLAEIFSLSRENSLQIGNSEIQLRAIVQLQRKRMEECTSYMPPSHFTSANTSYISERAQDVEREEADMVAIDAEANAEETKTVGIVVYDCETVENLRGCQDRVSPFFRKELPAHLQHSEFREAISLPQSHIPYTVQWGIVNMTSNMNQLLASNHCGILLHNAVHICYGYEQRLLGDCIEEFLHNMHCEAVSLGLRKVYCYAHNACGFDSYMILHFTHSKDKFKFKDILITSRGILSMEMEAILYSKKVNFIFRDTKLFFNASLSDLCKIFKVPSEFCKTDFPIARVHARNYFQEEFTRAVRQYMENDVWSLAYICRGINDIIRDHILHSRDQFLPITKNVTLMSLVTYLQRCEFVRHKMPSPFACDLPSLRNLVSYANMGGRVLPFWRDYRSQHAIAILRSLYDDWNNDTIGARRSNEYRSNLYKQMMEEKSFGKVMDVTSLYPYAMSHYPMPTGLIRYFEEATSLFFDNIVYILDCPVCHLRHTLCNRHLPGGEENLAKSLALGHFCFFVVREIRPPCYANANNQNVHRFANLCPRKTADASSLLYSFETPEEYSIRTFGKRTLPADVSCFTMFDLYWMHKTGWKFTIVGAFGFESTYIYRESLLNMFEERKKAKRMEREQDLPKSLSTMWKNVYNGGYGINARQDINKQHILCNEEETEDTLRAKCKINPDEIVVRDVAHSFQLANKQWLLKIRKHTDSAEYFAKQSPNHIGAAVTSASRHHMNLFLFSLNTHEYGYTDTDSVFITGEAWHRMCRDTPWLVDESPEAAMGTYKNDHESGKEECVIASFMIAKKVKLHVTLDKTGEVFFHETFKGFNPSKSDAESNRLHTSQYLLFQKVLALTQIYFFGKLCDNFQQTEWRRSLSGGITIIGEKPFDIDPVVYSTDNGFMLEEYTNPVNNDRHSLWIPHGWISYDYDLRLQEEQCSALLDPDEHNRLMRHDPFYLLWNALLACWGRNVQRYVIPENDREMTVLFTEKLPSLQPSDFSWC